MYPVLIKIFGFPLHSFGVLMGAGFMAAILYVVRMARRHGIDAERVFDLTFWVMVAGVGGCRLFYVLIDLLTRGGDSEFLRNPTKLIAIWEGGLVWYGGFILASVVVILYARKHAMPVWRVCDLFTPATFLGLGIGRVGCLMAGDDFGHVTDVPWAVTFTNKAALVYPESLLGQPLHPTQLYMMVNAFSLAAVCHLLLNRWRRFDGQVFGTGLMLYAAFRAFVEIYRGDFQRGFVPGTNLSVSQGLGIAVFAAGLAVLWTSRRARALPAASR